MCPPVALLFHSIPQPRHGVQMVNLHMQTSVSAGQRSDENQQAEVLRNFRVRESDLRWND
jgi:hypothetical protein